MGDGGYVLHNISQDNSLPMDNHKFNDTRPQGGDQHVEKQDLGEFLWNGNASFDGNNAGSGLTYGIGIFLSSTTILPASPAGPGGGGGPSVPRPQPLGGEIRIPLYCIIFVLALVGNMLVILTLVQNKKMRTVTNVFLLNLSVSDLLLTIFCMPFTLVPTLLRNFIFGKEMCVLIRYIQGKSTSPLHLHTLKTPIYHSLFALI